jgi:hypothetical protein
VQVAATLQYTYLAELMPPYLYKCLVETIVMVEEALLNNRLPPWIMVPPSSIPELVDVLRFWKKKMPFSTTRLLGVMKRHEATKSVNHELQSNPAYSNSLMANMVP